VRRAVQRAARRTNRFLRTSTCPSYESLSPVLVEKPIAHTLEEGKRLVQTAERSNAKLLVGHRRPHSPILHKAVETIKSRILGPIVTVIGSAVFYKPEG
jgi:predicted dehydrogenase